jgi:CelD/BcsL family acetyltransferase involved in cellulose biosynthesis
MRAPDTFPKEPLETLTVDPANPGDHLAAWKALAQRAVDPNPFFGPEFVMPFLEFMGPANVHLCVVRSGTTGEWRMAAPMGSRRLGLVVPAATGLATHYGPLGTPLLDPEAPVETAEVFLQLAADTIGRPLVAFPFLPLDGRTATSLLRTPWQLQTARLEARAAHAGGAAGEAQLAKAFSGKRRKELNRLLRRLSDEGEVRFDSHRGTATIEAFEAFLRLETTGWKGRAGTALLNNEAAARFARRMIAARAEQDAVRIDSFSVAGKVLAMLVVLLEGARAFSWKIAFDEGHARFSPGSQVTLHAFRTNLQEDGFEGADSLAVPGHKMIEPLWRGRMRYATLLAAASPTGRFLQLAGRADLSLERELRQVARRILRRPA